MRQRSSAARRWTWRSGWRWWTLRPTLWRRWASWRTCRSRSNGRHWSERWRWQRSMACWRSPTVPTTTSPPKWSGDMGRACLRHPALPVARRRSRACAAACGSKCGPLAGKAQVRMLMGDLRAAEGLIAAMQSLRPGLASAGGRAAGRQQRSVRGSLSSGATGTRRCRCARQCGLRPSGAATGDVAGFVWMLCVGLLADGSLGLRRPTGSGWRRHWPRRAAVDGRTRPRCFPV